MLRYGQSSKSGIIQYGRSTRVGGGWLHVMQNEKSVYKSCLLNLKVFKHRFVTGIGSLKKKPFLVIFAKCTLF